MKKIKFLLIPIAILALSCSSDDGGGSSSGINIDGENLVITDAKVTDNYHFFSDTHSEMEFVFSDDEITIDAEPGASYGFLPGDNATFAIGLTMYGMGNTFENGTYVYDINDDFDEPAFSFFDSCEIFIDSNNDGILNNSGDAILQATGGTVKVSGTAPNYVLKFNVQMSNGETLNFTYDNGLDYVDNRND